MVRVIRSWRRTFIFNGGRRSRTSAASPSSTSWRRSPSRSMATCRRARVAKAKADSRALASAVSIYSTHMDINE
jgi:hypothetical protein